MNTTKKHAASGFQSLEDIRPLVLAHGQLREAAGLGLRLPPSYDGARTAQTRRKGAVTGAA